MEDESEILEDALALAAVKITMPKGSVLHKNLAHSVSSILDCKWVTYDWLIKVVGRIMAAFESFQEFQYVIDLTTAVQTGMKQRGLRTINSIEEAFA